mgnify:CR=1 FL=1
MNETVSLADTTPEHVVTEGAFAQAPGPASEREYVRVRPLTVKDLAYYFTAPTKPDAPDKPPAVSAVPAECAEFATRVRSERPDLFPPPSGVNAPVLLAALAGYLVEKLFKVIADKLREQAKRYHADLAAAASRPAFWVPTANKDGWTAAFPAFEFRREWIANDANGGEPGTNQFAGDVGKVNCHIIFLLRPGEDARYVQVVPVFFRIATPRARTSTQASERGAIRVSVGARMSLNLPSNEHLGASDTHDIFDFMFVINNYLPGNGRPRKDRSGNVAGDAPGMALTSADRLGIASDWFTIPEPPYTPTEAAGLGNPFTLSVEAGETDLSNAAKIIEFFAELLNENKAAVSTVIKEKINPTK